MMSGIDQGMMPEHVRPQRTDEDDVDEREARKRPGDGNGDPEAVDDEDDDEINPGSERHHS